MNLTSPGRAGYFLYLRLSLSPLANTSPTKNVDKKCGGRMGHTSNELTPKYTMERLRAGLHYRPWSRTMERGLFSWSECMVQLPWSDFLKKCFESLGPLVRCKLNVDQEEWPCTKKWMCWFFLFGYMLKKCRTFGKEIKIKVNQVWSFSWLHFLLNVSQMWLANLLTTLFTQKWLI